MPNNAAIRQLTNHFILILAVSLTLFASGCDRQQAAKLPMLFEGDRVLAFGDSLTYGTGAQRQQSYPTVLSRISGFQIINEGIPGDTTQGGLERLPAALTKHEPALVLLCLGGNDFLRKKNASETRRNLSQMIGLLKAEKIPVVLIAVPRPGLSLKADPLFSSLASEFNIPLIEDVLPDILGQRDLKSDPIHPNAAGYQQMAESLHQQLDKLGAY